jgi:hypothetical protein
MTAVQINQAWASLHDLWGMTQVLVLSVGLAQLLGHFKELITRMQTLGRKSGKKFLVMYLKECVRMVIHFVNHQLYVPHKGGVEVRRSRVGLPTIIPGPLRRFIMDFVHGPTMQNTLVLRTILTVLSMYRVLQFRNLPDISSVTNGFSGTFKVFETQELLKVLKWFPKLILKPVKTVISEAAGPNGPRATWWAGADAIALGFHTSQWVAWVRSAIYIGRYGLVLWLVLIQVLVTPILPIMFVVNRIVIPHSVTRLLWAGRSAYKISIEIPMSIGRLTAIKEGAGKRRIIAITDWWTQTLLRPLHIAIAKLLELIPQDGTLDQWKPIEEWVLPRLRLGAKAFSFDLSSATDRLPIDLQVQILDFFIPGFGRWWKQLLDRDWKYAGTVVRYAVGQPMGALSSWVMLALSHHVIVQLAASRAGWTSWFPYYAVLGDDIVIADEQVALHYQSIINGLGVTINIQKSLISECGLLEFAKRWASANNGEISAFPPALLLRVWRSRLMLPVMILHLFNTGWLTFPNQMISSLESVRSILRIRPKLMTLLITTLVGPSALLTGTNRHVTAFAEQWFKLVTKRVGGSAADLIIRAYFMLLTKWAADLQSRGESEMAYLIDNFFKMRLLGGTPTVAGILSIPLILVSPGFYIYFKSCFTAITQNQLSASLNLAGLTGASQPSTDSIKFDLLDITSLASIKWTAKKVVSDQFKQTHDLMQAVAHEINIDLQNGTSVVCYEPMCPEHPAVFEQPLSDALVGDKYIPNPDMLFSTPKLGDSVG